MLGLFVVEKKKLDDKTNFPIENHCSEVVQTEFEYMYSDFK